MVPSAVLSVFRTGGPQPTSKYELCAPNPGWWCKETQGLYCFRQLVPYVQSERSILYSLHRSACSRGLQAGWERELVPGLGVERCGLLETLLSGSLGEHVLQSVACACVRAWFFRMFFCPPELSLAASFYNRKEGARSTRVSYTWSLM